MGRFSKEELEEAFAKYVRTKDECTRTCNWSPFADLFTIDCYYVEHAYGKALRVFGDTIVLECCDALGDFRRIPWARGSS